MILYSISSVTNKQEKHSKIPEKYMKSLCQLLRKHNYLDSLKRTKNQPYLRGYSSHLYHPCDFPSIIGYPTDWERGIEHYEIDSVPFPTNFLQKRRVIRKECLSCVSFSFQPTKNLKSKRAYACWSR